MSPWWMTGLSEEEPHQKLYDTWLRRVGLGLGIVMLPVLLPLFVSLCRKTGAEEISGGDLHKGPLRRFYTWLQPIPRGKKDKQS